METHELIDPTNKRTVGVIISTNTFEEERILKMLLRAITQRGRMILQVKEGDNIRTLKCRFGKCTATNPTEETSDGSNS